MPLVEHRELASLRRLVDCLAPLVSCHDYSQHDLLVNSITWYKCYAPTRTCHSIY